LPADTSIDNIDARYEAGILKMNIPVMGEKKKKYIIDVK